MNGFIKLMRIQLFFVLSIISSGSVLAQDSTDLNPLLEEAIQIMEDGDLLYSAKILLEISSTTKDSLLASEALYHVLKIGHAVAEKMNGRVNHKMRVLSTDPDSARQRIALWNRDRQELNQLELSLFNKLGIRFMNHYMSATYFYDFSNLIRLMIERYPQTIWTEMARAERLWLIDGHEQVIEEGESFLEAYPDSKYLPSIYGAMACAYADRWNLLGGRDSADAARLQAITFYKKALTLIPDGAEYYETNLQKLEQRQKTDYCFTIL